jgi:hypothetical protein
LSSLHVNPRRKRGPSYPNMRDLTHELVDYKKVDKS